VKASYAKPDGPIFDANEIHEDSPRKEGPWYCSTTGCTVQYKYHRIATYAVDEPGRVLRSGTFAHGEDRHHLPDCYMNEHALRQRIINDHAAVLVKDGDKLLLKWGRAPVKDAPSATPTVRRPRTTTTREAYAGILRAAADIARVVDDSDNDESVLARYWIIHHGIRYTWREFCYGPDGDDLHRIIDSIEGTYNPIAAPWPRLVRAIVSDPATSTDARVLLNLRAPTKRRNGDYVRLSLFAKPHTPVARQLLTFRSLEQVFVLADDWRAGSGRYGPSVWLNTPEQISAQ